jgi:hypothetical protein
MNKEEIINKIKEEYNNKSKEELIDILLNQEGNKQSQLELYEMMGAYIALKHFNVSNLLGEEEFNKKLDSLGTEIRCDCFKELYYKNKNHSKVFKNE